MVSSHKGINPEDIELDIGVDPVSLESGVKRLFEAFFIDVGIVIDR